MLNSPLPPLHPYKNLFGNLGLERDVGLVNVDDVRREALVQGEFRSGDDTVRRQTAEPPLGAAAGCGNPSWGCICPRGKAVESTRLGGVGR